LNKNLVGDKHVLGDYEFHENWCSVSYSFFWAWINSFLTVNLFPNLMKSSAKKCHMMFGMWFRENHYRKYHIFVCVQIKLHLCMYNIFLHFGSNNALV
jgi:hypothetical protein